MGSSPLNETDKKRKKCSDCHVLLLPIKPYNLRQMLEMLLEHRENCLMFSKALGTTKAEIRRRLAIEEQKPAPTPLQDINAMKRLWQRRGRL